jgi:hypothetical protein
VAVHGRTPAARLAEVDVTGQLANDEDVQPRHKLRLQARGLRKLLVAQRRAQVGEQPQVLAQAQDGLLGAQGPLQLVVLPVAHGAKEHGIGRARQRQRRLGQGVAEGLVGGAAHRGGLGAQG